MVSNQKRQEADDIQQKLLLMQTTQMILHSLQIHLLMSNGLHSLEQTVRGIDLHKKDKTEFMSFNQDGALSTFNVKNTQISRPIHIPQQQYLIYFQ